MKKSSSNPNTKRKCNYEKKQVTLDACHQQRVDGYQKYFDQRNALLAQIENIEKQLNIDNTNQELQDSLNVLMEELDDLKVDEVPIEDEIDYYTKTSDILYHYYESLENQTAPLTTPAIKHAPKKTGTKSILDFFASSTDAGDDNAMSDEATTIIEVKQNITSNKSTLYDKYLAKTDENYVKNEDDDPLAFCEHCGSEEIVTMINDGMTQCNQCNTVSFIIIDNDKPSYKEPQKEISYLNYKRKNHFNEWLNQIQGKETTEIPENIFNDILLEIKKLKVTNMADLSPVKIREILKKLKLNKYYEHAPYIYYRITGIPNQYLSPELEEKLRNMFEAIQVPFLRHSPPNRKNFLSYSYCIHKMLVLLGEDRYLSHFPLLKNREKLHQQELIWAKICKELNWEMIKSI